MTSVSTTKRLFQAVDALNQQDSDKRTCRRRPSDKRNAAAAQSQVNVHHSLVECRILLQRCHDGSTKLQDSVLSKLVMARDCLNRNDGGSPELLDLLGASIAKSNEDNTYEHQEEDHDNNERISDLLQNLYNQDRSVWKEVLDRSHKDVRLHAGAVSSKQFRSLDSSFFDQVEASVEHEKTRFDYNNRVDDSRLYQHILKDFVGSTKSTANGVPLRDTSTPKSKASVDRKASKGRKIRYTEIPKLVHFTFPLSRPETDLETNAWFRSLFGGSITAKSTKN